MHSRLLLNVFLLLLVIGLSLFLAQNTNDIEVTEVKLTTLDPNNVKQIQIIRRDLNEITFSKQNSQWLMQTPYAIAANKLRISVMLKLLQAHSYTQLTGADLELDRFLLDDPVVSIKYDDLKIDFGDLNPLGQEKRRYVLVNDTVHLVNDSLYHQLLTNATFFISPKLLPVDKKITALHLPEYTIHKIEGKWRIEPDMAISADNIITILNAWRELDAITVQKYASTDTQEKITIEFEQGETIEFLVVSPTPKLILARPEFNVQYNIGGYEAEKLFPKEEKL